VAYDNVAREATVVVEGYTRPNLVQILIKTVDPVTKIVPTAAVQRMDGLKTAAKSFMGIMETAVGPQPQDGSVDLVIRTGMMAFDSAIVRTVPMNWGYIADGEFDAMQPLAATNSAMTDGKNTVGTEEWVARTGTQSWRRWVTGRETNTGLGENGIEEYEVTVTPEQCGNQPTGDYNYMCSWDDGYGSEWRGATYGYERATETFSWRRWTYTCHSEEVIEYQCTPAVTETRYNGWEYDTGVEAPDSSGSK